MDELIDRAVGSLRWINEGVALVAGFALLGTVALILLDIALRRLGVASLGGTDEISGYVMAITTGWAMSYALTKLAHVRIDLLRNKLPTPGKAFVDIVSLWTLAATAIFIAIKTWPVLARSIRLDSAANTPLATPLWIPQSLWFAGWFWFALSASVLALALAWYVARGTADKAEKIGGVGTQL